MLQPYLKSLAILDQEHFDQPNLIRIREKSFSEGPDEQAL